MGLFSGPAEPVDPALAQKLIVSDKELKRANKALARNQALISSDLTTSGEELLLLAVGPVNSSMSDGVLAVTNRSVASYIKGKCDKKYELSEVHSTMLMTRPTGTMIAYIHTFKSELDFSPNDAMRFGHIISIEVGTPRPAQAICAAIDGITGRGRIEQLKADQLQYTKGDPVGLFSKKPTIQVCDLCGKADVEGCGHEFKHVEQISANGPAWLPAGLRAQGQGEYAWLCLHCNSFPAMKWPSEDAAAVALTIHLGAAHNKGRLKGMPQPFQMMSAG